MFNVTYRDTHGALRTENVEAADRAECVADCRRRGITPIAIREGRASLKEASHNGRAGSRLWLVVGGILCVAVLAGVWWWFSARSASAPMDEKRSAQGQKKTVLPKRVKVSDSQPVSEGKDAKDMGKKKSIPQPHPASGVASGAPELPTIPVAATNTPSIPPLPPQTFSNASDQVLAMIASADASGDMPPLPISRDIEAEFLESLKHEIVILDTDDERTRALKQAVKETRQELKRLIDSGMTVAQVLAEHQKLAGENAKVRNEAMMDLKRLVESGDIEGAKAYKRKINIALQQMGISELTIPVTDEERAERAAARRERMLKRRAEQAAAAERLKKENEK